MPQEMPEFFNQPNSAPPPSLGERVQEVLPGLSLGKILGDLADKSAQMWDQGRSELAQALFTDGTAYVPYGPGQNPDQRDNDQSPHGPAVEPERDRGREM